MSVKGENTGRWTKAEHDIFLVGLKQHGKGWKQIAAMIKTRTVVQVRTHAQKYFQKLEKARAQGRNGPVEMDCRDASMPQPIRKKPTSAQLSSSASSGRKRKADEMTLPTPTPAQVTTRAFTGYYPTQHGKMMFIPSLESAMSCGVGGIQQVSPVSVVQLNELGVGRPDVPNLSNNFKFSTAEGRKAPPPPVPSPSKSRARGGRAKRPSKRRKAAVTNEPEGVLETITPEAALRAATERTMKIEIPELPPPSPAQLEPGVEEAEYEEDFEDVKEPATPDEPKVDKAEAEAAKKIRTFPGNVFCDGEDGDFPAILGLDPLGEVPVQIPIALAASVETSSGGTPTGAAGELYDASTFNDELSSVGVTDSEGNTSAHSSDIDDDPFNPAGVDDSKMQHIKSIIDTPFSPEIDDLPPLEDYDEALFSWY